MISLIQLTPPAIEPITLAEAKSQLRVEHTADDALITTLITAARHYAEGYTARAFITQSWRLWLDGGIAADTTNITLPRAPLQNVTSITTINEDGVETAFSSANYYIDTASQPGRVVLKDGVAWPSILRRVQGVRVDYTCGYGTAAADVPAPLRQAMLQHIAFLYENRGDATAALPVALSALYQPYRIMQVA